MTHVKESGVTELCQVGDKGPSSQWGGSEYSCLILFPTFTLQNTEPDTDTGGAQARGLGTEHAECIAIAEEWKGYSR